MENFNIYLKFWGIFVKISGTSTCIENIIRNVGDNVAIHIPLVDRGRGDPRNILGVLYTKQFITFYFYFIYFYLFQFFNFSNDIK